MTARDRGWGWPGDPGSTDEAAYRRDHIATISVAGVKLHVRKEVAHLFAGFIKELADRGYRLDEMADDWGFANRDIRGYPGRKSNHAWGLAIDLNATENPMLRGRIETDMPDWVPDLARRWGLHWGGLYADRPDPMHFEFLGTPNDVDRYPIPDLEDDMFTDADRALLKQAAKDAADAKKLASSANHEVKHPKGPLHRVLGLVEQLAKKS